MTGRDAYGDPIPPGRIQSYLDRTIQEIETGCWLWTGWINAGGYAEVTVHYRKQLLHRLVYSALVRPLAVDEELHHGCPNKHCVNPAHVRALTKAEHAALHVSGVLLAFNEARRAATHCQRNHPFNAENTVWIGGRRRCRTCRREAGRRYDQKRAA